MELNKEELEIICKGLRMYTDFLSVLCTSDEDLDNLSSKVTVEYFKEATKWYEHQKH